MQYILPMMKINETIDIIAPLIFPGTISEITICPKGIVVPKIMPKRNLKANTSQKLWTKLCHNNKRKAIKLEYCNVLALPNLSAKKAHKRVPNTIPTKYELASI